MPRLLAVGHVTWDRVGRGDVLGGSVSYAALAAHRLGWESAVLTAAGADFDAARDLASVPAFVHASAATTRFQNDYDEAGGRQQAMHARADTIELAPLPDSWRAPDALLLAPVAGELAPGTGLAFEAGIVGAIAQGWVRRFGPAGQVSCGEWPRPRGDLAGVHVLFLSQHDVPSAESFARDMLELVPIVALTRGWEGVRMLTRAGSTDVPSLPRPELDATGAGDVFAAAFLVAYHELGDVAEAAAFAACAASCAVEGIGTSSLGDRAEVERRLALRERLIEEGDWDE
jgi:1D-myo-inositol 3-kinase